MKNLSDRLNRKNNRKVVESLSGGEPPTFTTPYALDRFKAYGYSEHALRDELELAYSADHKRLTDRMISGPPKKVIDVDVDVDEYVAYILHLSYGSDGEAYLVMYGGDDVHDMDGTLDFLRDLEDWGKNGKLYDKYLRRELRDGLV